TRIWHAKLESCFWISAKISGAFFGCIAPWKSIRDTLSAIKCSRPITNAPTRRANPSRDRNSRFKNGRAGRVNAPVTVTGAFTRPARRPWKLPLRSRLGLQLLLEPLLPLGQVRRFEPADYIKGALGLGLLAFLEEKSHLR